MNKNIGLIIAIFGVLTFILFTATIFMIAEYIPKNYGITNIEYKQTRILSIVEVTVENNKNIGMEIVAVFINQTEVKNSTSSPYIFPKPQVTIPQNSRTVLRIEDFRWKWSTLETKYFYEIKVITSDGTVFTKSKQTPHAPL